MKLKFKSLIIVVFLFLIGCNEPLPNDGNDRTNPDNTIRPGVTITEGKPVDPDLTGDKDEPDNSDNSAIGENNRAIIRDFISSYCRDNGFVKRLKVANELNKAGYTKTDGTAFRRSDIPKYCN